MERRTFFFSLASFPALLKPPSIAPTSPTQEAQPADIGDEIKRLEAYVKNHAEPFPWAEHNELRHLYGAVSEEKSLRHADIILAHSLMDDYMLNILSDWQLDGGPGRAVVGLLTKAERHPSLLHLRAACLLKAGDVCRENEKPIEAGKLYRGVIELAEARADDAPALKQYRTLAQFRVAE